MERRKSTTSTITSVSSFSNIMDPTPANRNTDDDATRHEPVVVQESQLPPGIDMSHILSAINSNKNHPELARILNSMTKSGSKKDKTPPVVFVVVDDSSKNSNSRNNAAINDQDFIPNRSMPATDRPGDHRRSIDRRWVNKNSIPPQYDDTYMKPFEKQYDTDVEMGTNRGSRVSVGRRSAPPASRDMWEDDEEDYYYDYYRHRQAYGNNTNKANRRSMHDGAYYDYKTKKPKEDPDYEEHLGDGRQYLRDIILGVNDGIVSTFLLIATVVGGGMPNRDILLTALAGTIAGAISMAAGEYIATKTQNEVMDGELKLEKKHIAENRDKELEELKEVFGNIGIPADDDRREVNELREGLLRFYGENDDAHLRCHAVLELGVVDNERRSEYVAGGVAFFLFLLGAMPTVIPFLATRNTESAFIASSVLTTLALLFVGGVKTWATRGNWVTAALENMAIAVGGGSIAYVIGIGFEKMIN